MEPGIVRMIQTTAATLDATLREYVREQLDAQPSSTVLPGTVMAFSGIMGGVGSRHPMNAETGTADTGYALCDGATYSIKGRVMVTPDLRGRFILGAGNGYNQNVTGGSASPSVVIDPHTLTVDQMPIHSHYIPLAYGQQPVRWTTGSSPTQVNALMLDSDPAGSSKAHSHTGRINDALPPYYALCYIMKL